MKYFALLDYDAQLLEPKAETQAGAAARPLQVGEMEEMKELLWGHMYIGDMSR